MSVFLKEKENNPFANLKPKDARPLAQQKVVNNGIQYKLIGTYEQGPKCFERVCLALQALFLTIISGGLGLIFQCLRTKWENAIAGSKHVHVYREESQNLEDTALKKVETPSSRLSKMPVVLFQHTLDYLSHEDCDNLFMVDKTSLRLINDKQSQLACKLLRQIEEHIAPEHPIRIKFAEISTKFTVIIKASISFAALKENLHQMFLEVIREISLLPEPLVILKEINLQAKAKSLGIMIPDLFLNCFSWLTYLEENYKRGTNGGVEYAMKSFMRMGAPRLASALLEDFSRWNPGTRSDTLRADFDSNNISKEKTLEIIDSVFSRAEAATNKDKKFILFPYAFNKIHLLFELKMYKEAAHYGMLLYNHAKELDCFCKLTALSFWLFLSHLDKANQDKHFEFAKSMIDSEDDLYVRTHGIKQIIYYLASNRKYNDAIEYLNTHHCGDPEQQIKIFGNLFYDFCPEGNLNPKFVKLGIRLSKKIREESSARFINFLLAKNIEFLRTNKVTLLSEEEELFSQFCKDNYTQSNPQTEEVLTYCKDNCVTYGIFRKYDDPAEYSLSYDYNSIIFVDYVPATFD